VRRARGRSGIRRQQGQALADARRACVQRLQMRLAILTGCQMRRGLGVRGACQFMIEIGSQRCFCRVHIHLLFCPISSARAIEIALIGVPPGVHLRDAMPVGVSRRLD
jgi:hypothetical protein